MNANQTRYQVKVDNFTRLCLAAICVLLVVLILGLWAEGVPPDRAKAADPPKVFGDSAAQRDEMVKFQKQTVEKLDELITLLKSGEVKVQVAQTGEKAGGGENVRPRSQE